MEGLGSVLPGLLQGGKIVYQLESNRVLDSYLGLRWDERILNVAEDFAYVIPGTIKYWLGQRSPIIEYKLIGEQYARTQVEKLLFSSLMNKSIKTSEILRKRCNVSMVHRYKIK